MYRRNTWPWRDWAGEHSIVHKEEGCNVNRDVNTNQTYEWKVGERGGVQKMGGEGGVGRDTDGDVATDICCKILFASVVCLFEIGFVYGVLD